MPNERATDIDGNLVEEVIDNGDGTGTRTTYEDGEVATTEALTGLPIPEPVVPTPEEQIADLQETVELLLAIIEGE